MENNLLERIQTIMEKDGESETSFSKKIGVSQTTLNRKLKSAEIKQLMDLVGWILLAYPDVSRTWLLTGKGNMIRQKSSSSTDHTELVDLFRENQRLHRELEILLKKENASLKGEEGEKNFSASHACGDGNAAHTLQRKTE